MANGTRVKELLEAERAGGVSDWGRRSASMGPAQPRRLRADPEPCLHCGQPTRQQIAAQAQLARGALELVLDRLGWPPEPALSAALDRLLVLTEEGA